MPFTDVQFHPNGSAIGAASTEGSIKIYDLKTGFLQQCYDAHEGQVNKARFHPNGKFMLTASKDSTMKVLVIHIFVDFNFPSFLHLNCISGVGFVRR